MEVVASLSQGRTAVAQCGLFTYKSVPVIFEPPCILSSVVVLTSRSQETLCRYGELQASVLNSILYSKQYLVQSRGSALRQVVLKRINQNSLEQ